MKLEHHLFMDFALFIMIWRMHAYKHTLFFGFDAWVEKSARIDFSLSGPWACIRFEILHL